jgi:uncharacterized protein (DUF362 family)/Pyruvate/2-oxoacid:ferredoxin oxidoreductase delta subunit
MYDMMPKTNHWQVNYRCEDEDMSKVALLRCESYDLNQVMEKIETAIGHLGGLAAFVKKDAKVFVKLNCVGPFSPELGITSHPVFVQAIIRLLKRFTADITVGDNPATRDQIYTLKKCGLYDMLVAENVKIFAGNDTVIIENPAAKYFRQFEVARAMVEPDILINVPKLKTHSLTYMTVAQKNLFGLIYGLNKAGWHVKAKSPLEFAEALSDLYGAILHAFARKMILHICDGIIGIEGDGPSTAGQTKHAGMILASTDAISLDRVAVEAVSLNHRDFHMNKIAGERGYGESDIDKIAIVGDPITAFTGTRFKAPENQYNSFIFKMLKVRRLRNVLLEHPVVIPDSCIRCGECVKICPPKVMTIRQVYPAADRSGCIRCWCCMEVCPQNAITKSKRPLLGRILLRSFK